ncbi:Rhodanese/Cell cycle control phosphatase superfamily protein [Perilla frutescens var. frutescens]|nr:Rhodanese/Cell cycle control phosphatase superfamily protein [Perilla frutescens var. frutescens]
MLPVSSATTSCSCHGQIPVYGGLKSFSSYPKALDCNNVNKSVKNFSNFSRRRAVTCFYSNYVGKVEQCSSIDTTINQSLYQSDESRRLVPKMIFVDSSSESAGGYQITDYISKTIDSADPELPISVSDVPIDSAPVSDSLNVDVNPLSVQSTQFSDIINGGEDVLNKSLDTISSSWNAALTSANEAVDNVISDVITFLNKTGESAGNKLSGFSSGVKEGSGSAGAAAVDVLRRAVVTVEDLLAFGTKNIGYAYGSAKGILPQEYQDVLRLSEGRVVETLSPIGAAFQQAYIALEGLEKSLGLDPNDPLIPVVLVFGVSAILWGSSRVLKYSGYAGDLSPESALELLRGNDNASLRDRDGVPDLRRSARFRYASITLPEVNSSVKKLLKGGRDVEDSLLAVVIRDLKIVQDRSKVLVMDADGSRSKSVARSLQKLGTKRPYQVLGGFQSWVNEGCRVKELKPETTLTILNEEAEAILEEIKPTPLKVLGFGVVAAAAAYSLVEWETTLQFIGVIGLGQTIFRRIGSYQGADEIKQDLRFLLAPVALGGQAISWAAGKLEPNRNGLPTSPSSLDVQSRVLQAAAKLESQPPAATETQDLPQVAASGNEEVNISEA